MTTTPTASFSTIGLLSDILRDLPIASPVDYNLDDNDDGESSNATSQTPANSDAAATGPPKPLEYKPNEPLSKIRLFDNKQDFDKSIKLLDSNDPALVDVLNRTLSQIDTSKITIKPSYQNSSQTNRIYFTPLLQSVLVQNPKLFNGSINEQLSQFQAQNHQQQPQHHHHHHQHHHHQQPQPNLVKPPVTGNSSNNQNYQQPTSVNVQQQLQSQPQLQPHHHKHHQLSQAQASPSHETHKQIEKHPNNQQLPTPVQQSYPHPHQQLQQQPQQQFQPQPVQNVNTTTNNNNNIVNNQNQTSLKTEHQKYPATPNKVDQMIESKPDIKKIVGTPTSVLDPNVSSESPAAGVAGANNSGYTVISDPNKLSLKISKVNQAESNANESIKTNKFYSSSSSFKQTMQSPQIVERTPKSNNPAQQQLTDQQAHELQMQANANSASKKAEKAKTAAQLSTWQANLASQLQLPDDFTPELISQLAAEGYDLVSGSGRKARQKPTHPPAAQPSQYQQRMLDLSDDENDQDLEYNPSAGARVKQRNDDLSVTMNRPNKSAYRLLQHHEKMDLQDPTDHPSFKRFNQLLDDLFDTYEQDLQQININNRNGAARNGAVDNDSDEIPSEYLLSRQMCYDLVQEAFKLNSYSIMNLIRKESLYKLQNLLFFNIKDGIRSLHLMNEEATGDQDRLFKDILYEKLLKASDCSVVSLIIMTSSKVAKELVIEDIIEQIAAFVKLQLTQTIYPHYDPVYKNASTTSSEKAANTTNNNPKRKLINQFSNSALGHNSPQAKQKHMQHFYNRMREILNLLAELVCQIDMTDTIVITLSSFSVMCFFVENINDLQLEALKILTNLFSRYAKHRQLVMDDILSSLIKLHPTKRNSRTYKCFNGDAIQMFSALVLQLLQCEVNTIDYVQHANSPLSGSNEQNGTSTTTTSTTTTDDSGPSFEEKETYLINAYDQSSQTAKKFLSIFFSKCKTKQADFDFRPLFESFIQDLLTTVNKPEWPIAEIILNLLGMILVNQIQNEQSDVSSRVNSLEYLGQIVSQLRKDSLEYQKCPERILNVVEKLKTEKTPNNTMSNSNQTPTDPNDLFSMQKSLIFYLDSQVANDSSLLFSKYFLIAQWLKELNQQAQEELNQNGADQLEHGQDRVRRHAVIEENRKRLYSLIETKKYQHQSSIDGRVEILLDLNEAFIVSKYLCSLKKTLDKNFDFYLINILNLSGAGSDPNTPTQVRSKAIKCLSLIIEADPQILLKQKVFACVETNFLHQTISVREASVDLIGRFITLKPELTNHYYKLLSDRILDVGVSVRKRAIKIFRDICLQQPDFQHLSEICVKILKRIMDEDNIKKLVIDTFYSLWFTPINTHSKELLVKRVLNLVDVVSEFNIINNPQSLELFESLFNALIVNPSSSISLSTGSGVGSGGVSVKEESTAGSSLNTMSANEQEQLLMRSKDVIKSCKQIVDCLIENVLNNEANTSSPQAYKRLVASFSTLYLLSKIKPENFINHAETLLPYLNIKSTNQNDNQIINSAAKILECVVPLLQSPSNSFLISLEESLCKLIFQGGMMIVSSCISCLGTVVNKLTKNYKLAADCLSKFYNNSSYLKRTINPKKPLEANTKPLVFRMLFTLGLLSKNFDVEADEFKEYQLCTKQDLFSMFIYFIKNFDVDVQQKALFGLGSFLTRYSEYMMKDEIKTLYMDYIKRPNVPVALKSQVFLNLTDYLNEEDKKNLVKSVELSKHHCKDDLKEMLDVQQGMASTIIQAYLRPILDSYLTTNLTLRVNVFNCLSLVLNQGLVYPIDCVPYLIAMTTDYEKKIQTKALSHLTNLQKAHPNFVQSKSIAGVNISFHLQKIIKKDAPGAQRSAPGVEETTGPMDGMTAPDTSSSHIVRGFTENNEILSQNHHLYSLLRTNKSYRRAFLQQLLKMFDDSSLHHTSLAHMLYISDNLAYFPYQLLDEPLYLIHQIDMIISVTGINLLQTFKENLLNHQMFDSGRQAKVATETSVDVGISMDDQLMTELGLNQDCPQEAEDELIKLNQLNSNANNQTEQMNVCSTTTSASLSVNNNYPTSAQLSQGSKRIIDDEDETFESVYDNMPSDLKPLKDCMYKAQGCCLLLILKQFLKEVYSISDSKIQNYSPTDTAKVNDRPITSRKTNRKFNPKQIIDYILRSESHKEDDDETKQALVREYLEFKELMLSIDQEEKIDENRPNATSMKTSSSDTSKLSVLHQKLFEGIEKTTRPSNSSGQDSTQATPSKPRSRPKNKNLSSSAKKSSVNSSSKSKRKRKKDSDDSFDSDSASDYDDEI